MSKHIELSDFTYVVKSDHCHIGVTQRGGCKVKKGAVINSDLLIAIIERLCPSKDFSDYMSSVRGKPFLTIYDDETNSRDINPERLFGFTWGAVNGVDGLWLVRCKGVDKTGKKVKYGGKKATHCVIDFDYSGIVS
jgi:hypothetical protein